MEKQWIREIQRTGSQAAANHLIRAHYDEIYRFVYRQTGHKEDAMDLTQFIFLAMQWTSRRGRSILTTQLAAALCSALAADS